jgi:hypothetical protein
MPLWGWFVLILILILAARWVQVSKALAAQQPSVEAMAQVAQSVPAVRSAIDDLLAHPDMDMEDVQAGWELVTDFQETVKRAPSMGISSEGMHYVRHWGDYADLAVDMYTDARSRWDGSPDPVRFPEYRARLSSLDAKGLAMVAANPTPSFFRMLLTGVPKVNPID